MTTLSDFKAAYTTSTVLSGDQALTGRQAGNTLVRGNLTVTGDFIVPGNLYVEGDLTINSSSFYVEGDVVANKYVSGTFTNSIFIGGRFVNLDSRFTEDTTATVVSSTYNYFQSVTTVGAPVYDGISSTTITINTSVPDTIFASARITPFTSHLGSLISASGTTVVISGDVTGSVPNGTTLRLYIGNNNTLVIVDSGGMNTSTYLTPATTNRGWSATQSTSNNTYYVVTGNATAFFTTGTSVSISSEAGGANNPDLGISLTGDGYGELVCGQDFVASGNVTLINIPLTTIKGSLLFQGINTSQANALFSMQNQVGIATPPSGSLATTHDGPSLLVFGDVRGFLTIASVPRNSASYSGQAGSITIRGSVDGKGNSVTITAKGLDTSTASLAAGSGGLVTIGGNVYALSTIETYGGNASGSGTNCHGGTGGSITVRGDVFSAASIILRSYGGNASASGADSIGGNGSAMNFYGDVLAVAAITIDAKGGGCGGNGGTSGPGNGGNIFISGSLVSGSTGTLTTAGNIASSGSGACGSGGTLTVGGNIVNITTVNTSGGDGFQSTSGNGGNGGNVTIGGNFTHSTGSTNINMRGGTTSGTGASITGGTGGSLTIRGDHMPLGTGNQINTRGGDTSSTAANGGVAGSVSIAGACNANSGITATGGAASNSAASGRGSAGGAITIRGNANIGSTSTTGGSSGGSAATQSGPGGAITIIGFVTASLISSSGGGLTSVTGPASITNVAASGAIDLRGGGTITGGGVSISADGGVNSHTTATGAKNGGAGGAITLHGSWNITGTVRCSGGGSSGGTTSVGGTAGGMTLVGQGHLGSTVLSNGGTSNAGANAGNGATITLSGVWTCISTVSVKRGATGNFSGTTANLALIGNISIHIIDVSTEYFILPGNATFPVTLRMNQLATRTTLTDSTATTSTAAITSPDQKVFLYAPTTGTSSKWYALTGTLI